VNGGSVRRLTIDQLRVALSRPTERLIWVDASSDPTAQSEAGRFLRPLGEIALHPMNVEGLRACLQEEELDLEERIQRCQRDARQLVDVKPDLAWSRAHQAVTLLGTPGELAAVSDPAARETAYMTLADVCFQLGIRKKSLSPELGRPDLFDRAAHAARVAGKFGLASAMQAIGAAERGPGPDRLSRIADAVQLVVDARKELPAWLLVEITPRADFWLRELDRHMDVGDNPLVAHRILPPFFDALGLPDAQARKDRLVQRAMEILMKNRRHAEALTLLERLPEAQPRLAAECYEQVGQLSRAAEVYLKLGERDKALRCYRSAPDFTAALALVRGMGDHAARASLEWVAEVDALLARRPENFNRVMTQEEKKLLESLLERGLGVQRKKPAVKRQPAKKAVSQVAAKRTPRKPKL
jgi:tetratricopeptide (TPR) repeat protein